MKRPMRAIAAAALLIAGAATAFVTNGVAHADTQICEQYGTATIQNRYVVQNNRWGTSAEQCINVTGTGFSITRQQGVGNTSGAPVSYPSIFVGCHYTKCSPGTNLPIQVSAITNATSSIDFTYVSGTYDAAYDIWLDPSPKRDGVNQMEIMIWFNRQGNIQPIGSPVGNTTIGGRTWEVWQGSNGANNVISYVAPSAIPSWNFSVLDFINDTRNRGAITNSWYLTSIQAGFEPWIGGAGLAVNSFSASVNGTGTNPTTVPTTSSPSPTPTATTTPPAPAGGCAVTYDANSWNGGFTANVTVRNTSTSPINGWDLGFALPAGQQVGNSWNATVTQNGQNVSAKNIGWNGVIAAGASASFGFQASSAGAFAKPGAFTLNGTACAVA
ncbi:cellulose binding domain-containing protein [Catenuloplanes sp. NPDC051500]|uniref:GH12 family glycosyl hydrolase domain-containing protein n=1 Tax=Catenuloplanes sp. NPDC051500 TaxID=3363959 RepID=UPI0037A84882